MFKNSIENYFSNIKKNNISTSDFYIYLKTKGSYLRPLTKNDIENNNIVSSLAEWRTNLETYPNKFTATFEGTKSWMERLVIEVPDRILFLLFVENNKFIGHMGFANVSNENRSIEIDNVVRGVKFLSPGIMKEALISLMSWGWDNFKPSFYNLRTLETNIHAINFYKKIGFEVFYTEPLKKIITPEGFNHESIPQHIMKKPDNYYIHMKYLTNKMK